LDGRILPYPNNDTALDQLSVLFTNYINNIASTVVIRAISATQPDGSVVEWLSQGITSLTSSIPFVPPIPINPIKDVLIRDIDLAFSKDQPWSPTISSKHLQGSILLPFGFSIKITKLATQLSINYKGSVISSVKGAYAEASTHVTVQSRQETYGSIALTLPPSPMTLPNLSGGAKGNFVDFEKALVSTNGPITFIAQGSAED
jgi:hypothetical protein